jgi:hypothetical protein
MIAGCRAGVDINVSSDWFNCPLCLLLLITNTDYTPASTPCPQLLARRLHPARSPFPIRLNQSLARNSSSLILVLPPLLPSFPLLSSANRLKSPSSPQTTIPTTTRLHLPPTLLAPAAETAQRKRRPVAPVSIAKRPISLVTTASYRYYYHCSHTSRVLTRISSPPVSTLRKAWYRRQLHRGPSQKSKISSRRRGARCVRSSPPVPSS